MVLKTSPISIGHAAIAAPGPGISLINGGNTRGNPAATDPCGDQVLPHHGDDDPLLGPCGDQVLAITLRHRDIGDLGRIITWCDQHCQGLWGVEVPYGRDWIYVYRFELRADAMLFALTWADIME